MGKNGIDELFSLFEDVLSPSDVLASKIMAQISTSVTKERLKLHMNQAEFAKYINASQSLVSRWEHGDYNFTIRKIAEIAAVLNLDVNISFCDASIPRKNSIEYSGTTRLTKTIRFSDKNEYTSKRYISPTPSNTYLNKEENKHASVC